MKIGKCYKHIEGNICTGFDENKELVFSPIIFVLSVVKDFYFKIEIETVKFLDYSGRIGEIYIIPSSYNGSLGFDIADCLESDLVEI